MTTEQGFYLDLSSISQSEGKPVTDLGFLQSEALGYLEDYLSGEKSGTAKHGMAKGAKVADEPKDIACIYHAPYFAIQNKDHNWSVRLGNCHHWDCPRCGTGRAKKEYWRIIQGCDEITKQGHQLYFLTLTTRGAGLSVKEAEANYLLWTNRCLSNLRYQSVRDNGYWCYVQVTERQNRHHPHSHILTTYKPVDLTDGTNRKWKQRDGKKEWYDVDCLRSESLQNAIRSSGLGEQYDISEVREASAVSRYVAKYLFKKALHTVWPSNWHRVRYSRNWPKSEKPESENVLVLLRAADWYNLATLTDKVVCYDHFTAEKVKEYLHVYPVVVREKTTC